ncbi:MAG TPA: alpha/beta fold hydrolase [Phycisphaerae bacterium]|nr:alpha/beta fold hydrolase [Phycisphaerae bacterium]HOJ72902.1 alpha/beta fold hydrolase [Phycisphaerae bacterium]HOQ88343.1 alpha/beta fold hydrolase [Phycisphaerae bacterium]
MAGLAGCVFDERAIPMKSEYFVPVRVSAEPEAAGHVSQGRDGQADRVELVTDRTGPARVANTREWLRAAHAQLEHLLPPRGRRVLLTEDMLDEQGRPVDVYRYFDRPPETLNKLHQNWNGMVHTGQAVSRSEAIDEPVPPWEGFRTVWIPVAERISLHGRLAVQTGPDGEPVDADCIVLIPGFLGDNAVLRTRDLAFALRDRGFHVLALELRGHGRVEYYYPDVYYNFGVIETQDLMRVSEWLQDHHPFIRNTGLIGFCWGGNHAMLAAWYDGRRPDDPSITPRVAAHLDPPTGRKHYTAGVIAFSPVLTWERLMEDADTPREDMWTDPSMYFFQQTVKSRMRRKGYPEVSGSLRRLINYEFAHSEFGPSFPIVEGYQFLRFMPHRGQPDGDKMEFARIPVLMVTSVNDPFLPAQDMADFTARTDNPLVATLILRGGGHIGFGPYNPAYFYSLILNYFDPVHGAAAVAGTRE